MLQLPLAYHEYVLHQPREEEEEEEERREEERSGGQGENKVEQQ